MLRGGGGAADDEAGVTPELEDTTIESEIVWANYFLMAISNLFFS